MAKFDNSIEYVLQNEGGYCIDDGGPTNFGIVIDDVAKFRGVPASSLNASDMKALSKQEALAIYRQQYWAPLVLDFVNDQNIATSILDIGVNKGLGVGARYAQKVCCLLGHEVVVDGKIGTLTIQALNACDPAQFIRQIEGLDVAGYEALIANNPHKYARYRIGWERRAKRLLTLIPSAPEAA